MDTEQCVAAPVGADHHNLKRTVQAAFLTADDEVDAAGVSKSAPVHTNCSSCRFHARSNGRDLLVVGRDKGTAKSRRIQANLRLLAPMVKRLAERGLAFPMRSRGQSRVDQSSVKVALQFVF
ncbi:hypothetical protein XU06_29795 (plasmid) [Rhodococcus erythropolis]|uniref:hypothetical protein n=1 Tax=Rhodococcus erythropolis TaxID=1833 RepID=UPI00061B66B6|nr:hypothetical protein [Rhodococcus erythropolis]AKE01147.1 hypothetical protein XU06_29795 [Rhodococcus erythropolis]